MSQYVHDIPGLGVCTQSFVDGFGTAIWASPEEDELRESFLKNVSFGKDGKLDQNGVAEALRQMNKCERKVNQLVRSMGEGGTVDFEGFKALAIPASKRIPVLGHCYTAVDSFCSEAFDGTILPLCAPSPDDRSLEKLFVSMDEDSSGTVDKSELANCLRRMWYNESQISAKVEDVNEDLTMYQFKHFMRGPKYQPYGVDEVPLIGPPIHSHFCPHPNIPLADVRAAFEHVDRNKDQKIDKTEVGDCLRELGRTEAQVQELLDRMPGAELDFEGFQTLMDSDPEARNWLLWVNVVPLPNVAKIHDTPAIGTVTHFGQDTVVNTWHKTVGAYLNNFVFGDTELEVEEKLRAQFREADTDKDGRLSEKEFANLLRRMGRNEYQIKLARDRMEDRLAGVTEVEFIALHWRWV